MSAPTKVVEELCVDPDCARDETHWHPFEIERFRGEPVGEYSLTLRVRFAPAVRARGGKS